MQGSVNSLLSARFDPLISAGRAPSGAGFRVSGIVPLNVDRIGGLWGSYYDIEQYDIEQFHTLSTSLILGRNFSRHGSQEQR